MLVRNGISVKWTEREEKKNAELINILNRHADDGFAERLNFDLAGGGLSSAPDQPYVSAAFHWW